MRFHDIKTCDFSNGEGCRVTLFVSGCNHGCKGCYNSSTWNPNSGKLFTDVHMKYILDELKEHDGFSISGGDPLHPRNREMVRYIVKTIKTTYPEKDIWMWSGYTFDEIKHLELMKYVDIFIDGRYDKELPTDKPWRGSDNQRMYKNGKLYD